MRICIELACRPYSVPFRAACECLYEKNCSRFNIHSGETFINRLIIVGTTKAGVP